MWWLEAAGDGAVSVVRRKRVVLARAKQTKHKSMKGEQDRSEPHGSSAMRSRAGAPRPGRPTSTSRGQSCAARVAATANVACRRRSANRERADYHGRHRSWSTQVR